MQPNPLDDIVSSAVRGDKSPVMLVHKTTGGYARRDGDLQIVAVRVEETTNQSNYFRMALAAQHNGNNLYTFENLQVDGSGNRVDSQPVVMSANPGSIGEGIMWVPAKSLRDNPDDDAAKAQHWYVVPQSCGGYAILSYLNPVWALGLMGKTAKVPECGRPVQTVYAVIPDICHWVIVAPNPDKECIPNDDIPQV